LERKEQRQVINLPECDSLVHEFSVPSSAELSDYLKANQPKSQQVLGGKIVKKYREYNLQNLRFFCFIFMRFIFLLFQIVRVDLHSALSIHDSKACVDFSKVKVHIYIQLANKCKSHSFRLISRVLSSREWRNTFAA
jgi:hypothetical protein